MNEAAPSVSRRDDRILMPGFATAHSHAFQRALRGRTQRRATDANSFWSWRGLMYELAERLDPEDVFHISRFAFVELALSGVTAIGEFHYLHHQRGGAPYEDRLMMADAVIRAAQEAGLRITLIRTAYFRAGFGRDIEPTQRRFYDPSVDLVIQDTEALIDRYADDPLVNIALAAHSIRAVPRGPIVELAAYARSRALPFHMHVAEQPREVAESIAEHGMRPVQLLAQDGVLDDRFVAVHAMYLLSNEVKALGEAKAFVCLCRTTERDLGDGLPETAALIRSGVRLCVGVDSHSSGDAFEEVRAVELDERSHVAARHVAAEAPELLLMATRHGYEAIGMGSVWSEDRVYLNAHDPSLVGVSDEWLVDAVIFSVTPRAVDEVVIAGRTVVKDGWHVRYEEARRGYEITLRKLGLC